MLACGTIPLVLARAFVLGSHIVGIFFVDGSISNFNAGALIIVFVFGTVTLFLARDFVLRSYSSFSWNYIKLV